MTHRIMVCHAVVAARQFRIRCYTQLLLMVTATFSLATELSICVGRQEQAPFVFTSPKTGELTGLGIDILAEVAKQLDHTFQLKALPQARCIEDVKRGRHALGLNMSTGVTKQAGLMGSEAYFKLHPELYVLSKVAAKLPAKPKPSDLVQLQLCGLSGLSYEDFGISSQQVDTGTNLYSELVQKLLLGRCEGMLEFREIVAGLYLIDKHTGELASSARISRLPLLDQPVVGLHLVASDTPGGRQLIQHLNPVLIRLRKEHRIEQMLSTYLQQ
ncbi:substrate-binding periplasmic protein [Chitinimonas sp. BJB300]|uniref:substrate-binding periplasmic protein n=1 Tax=Chitinimonas sp. BJB300 TaxID=1559339 RepID=UPI001303FE31|nr:transporter substrate-binding domain-containing protein [Chitinimonas sp. BJB300]